MVNATMETFGFPHSLVREFDHWAVLVRPAQVTLGSLVLVSTSEATAFGQLDGPAFAELGSVIPQIERALEAFVKYEKINYLMLMMVDPHVHFHVIPRYSGSRSLGTLQLSDPGWPGPPDLKSSTSLNADDLNEIRLKLVQLFS